LYIFKIADLDSSYCINYKSNIRQEEALTMQTIKNIVIFIPAILGVIAFLLMIPGSFFSGDVAKEAIKNYNPAFTALLSDVKGDLNERVRELWITFSFVGAIIGLASALTSIQFPLVCGKALLLDCVIVAFVCIAFNIFTFLALLFYIASGAFSLLLKRE
jgi:hypothetical protein